MRVFCVIIIVLALTLSGVPGLAQQGPGSTVRTESSTYQAEPPADCKYIPRGGPIAGIVVASVFWFVLPMSIPVWITQGKKLKRRNKERYQQQAQGCPAVP